MILVIDNYDSFTFNLVHTIGELNEKADIRVVRNDQIGLDDIQQLAPHHIIISPGPCTPHEAGISVDVVKRFAGAIPILGVCLGHQSIGQATGAQIVRAKYLMHGKTDVIHHDGRGLFQGIPSPLIATRYHSLVIDPATLNSDFHVTAWADDADGARQVMAIEHATWPLYGVQFHPESFLTEHGHDMLANFLRVGPI